MTVKRDEFGQYDKDMSEFTEWEWSLFSILEDMCSSDNEDKTIAAFMADVLDLIDQRNDS